MHTQTLSLLVHCASPPAWTDAGQRDRQLVAVAGGAQKIQFMHANVPICPHKSTSSARRAPKQLVFL